MCINNSNNKQANQLVAKLLEMTKTCYYVKEKLYGVEVITYMHTNNINNN